MAPAGFRCWHKRFRLTWLKPALPTASLLLFGAGCAQLNLPATFHAPKPFTARALGDNLATPQTSAKESNSEGMIVQTVAQEVRQPPSTLPESLPTPQATQQPQASVPAAESATSANVLPISLDTVLRLAEEQNAQIAQARERVREAYAEKDVAKTRWLPDIFVGTAFYRHEGGIQNEDGTLTHSSTGALFAGLEIDGRLDVREVAFQQINARRKVWQQRGDLSRVTSETLLDAANTYIDLLSARAGEAIAVELEQKFNELLQRAKKAAELEKVAQVEVYRIQSELDGQRQMIAKLRAQAYGASAKLAYLLGLDPCTVLVPVDARLFAFDLVDATPPVCDLVNHALTNGPGVREMEGLLALIQESMERAKGLGQYLPIFEVRLAEGGFGAGAGDRLDWDNRLDLALQARWNLTPLFSQQARRRAAQAKVQQAHLAYQDLRGKLTAGVREARETILGGKQEMTQTGSQVENAQHVYELSKRRLEGLLPQQGGASYTEVLLAIGTIGRAKGNVLSAISAYDKAQLRLLVLMGAAACNGPGGAIAK